MSSVVSEIFSAFFFRFSIICSLAGCIHKKQKKKKKKTGAEVFCLLCMFWFSSFSSHTYPSCCITVWSTSLIHSKHSRSSSGPGICCLLSFITNIIFALIQNVQSYICWFCVSLCLGRCHNTNGE